MKREIPFEIPAGATEELECTLETSAPGDFAYQLHLYIDDIGLREQILQVRGTARAKD